MNVAVEEEEEEGKRKGMNITGSRRKGIKKCK
mgnify:CR=1 FL=1